MKEVGLKDHDYYGLWDLNPSNLVSGPLGKLYLVWFGEP